MTSHDKSTVLAYSLLELEMALRGWWLATGMSPLLAWTLRAEPRVSRR